MHYDKVALVIILTLFLVVFYNVGLFLAYRDDQSKNSTGHIIARMSKRAKDPWKDENDALKELSQRVHDLQASQDQSGSGQSGRDQPGPDGTGSKLPGNERAGPDK